MSNEFLLAFFKQNKRAHELLLDIDNPLWSSYLNARQEYKEKTFNKGTSEISLSVIIEEFNRLINILKNEDLERFILNTAVQDIIVFNQLMINEIQNLPKEKPVSVKTFLSNKIGEYQVLVNNNYVKLPENIKIYITKSRFKYKESLYVHSKVSVNEFYEINNTYNSLVSSLDEDTKNCFVNTLKYQDFIAICNFILEEFN
jgi:hypothetical protein